MGALSYLQTRVRLLSAISLAMVVFLIYSNVYDMGFVYDDEFYIQKNKFLDSFHHVGKIFSSNSTAGSGFEDSFYRPLQFFLYLLIQQIFGEEPWGFHLLNVLIHATNAILIYFLGRQIGFSQKVSYFSALLWAVHPVHTEVIAYISGTADPLQCAFTLAGLLCLLSKKKFSFLMASLFFIAALLSKEVAVVFPGLALSLLFLTSENRWKWKTYLPVMGFLVIGLTYVALRATVLNFNGDFQFYKSSNIYTENLIFRIYTFLATLPAYFGLMVWPVGFHIDRAFPVYTSLSQGPVFIGLAMLFSGLGLWIFLFCYQSSVVPFATAMVVWFASAHSLHSGILVPMNSLFLEHWLYVPSISVAWVVVAMTKKIVPKFFFYGGLVSLMVTLSVLTFQQNRMWESPMTLFSRILEFNPKATRVRHNLAMAYSEAGNDELALKQYELSLQQEPQSYPQTYHNMALIYLKRNDLDQGERYLLKAIEISERFRPSYEYLIQLYQFKKDQTKLQQWQQQYRKIFGKPN